MKTIKIFPQDNPVTAEVTIPGSLSYTIRALNLAVLTNGSVTIHNALESDDVQAMLDALSTLGIGFTKENSSIVVNGSIAEVADKDYEIDINISGRTGRSLLGLLCIVPGTKVLTCKPAFKKRPVGELVNGLRQLGAHIEYLEKENFLPVKITTSKLHPGNISMKGSISSQFFSSILMIAPCVGEITITVEGEQTSKSFIDVTISSMGEFGVTVENNKYKSYRVPAGQTYTATDFYIEADAIAAGYFWGIAAVTGSTIRVLNLSSKSKQGDVAFADVLTQMGCIKKENVAENWLEITGPEKLIHTDANMNSMPDSAQTLAVVAAYAEGTTHISGLDNLRIKETDRIAAPEKELRKMGLTVSSTYDTLTVTGGKPRGTVIDTYGDHRMAMSFAVAGSKTPKILIRNPAVVSKSFPGFWETLHTLGIKTE
jgi:3-phosphoshikimate 1-carboxyvinyltransferase